MGNRKFFDIGNPAYWISVFIVMELIILAGAGLFIMDKLKEAPKTTPVTVAEKHTVAKSPTLKSPSPILKPPTAMSDALKKLALAGKGGGIERSYIRQIAANPSIIDGVKVKIKEKIYDLKDCKTVGAQAHLIALSQGLVNGREFRVKRTDKFSFVLEKDNGGNLNTVIYEKSDGKFIKNIPIAKALYIVHKRC